MRPDVEGIQFGRSAGDSRFYWYCSRCAAYEHHERLSFAQLAGITHMRVNHD
jgi:hypothetical protein